MSKITKDIVSYLSELRDDDFKLEDLYNDEFTTLTVFRSLRGLTKQYIMNLLLCNRSLKEQHFQKLISQDSIAHHKATFYKLKQLRILSFNASNGQEYFYLNTNFANCLKKVLLVGATNDNLLISKNTDRINEYISEDNIKKFEKEKWEHVLNCLINANKLHMDDNTLRGIVNLLNVVGLIKINDGVYDITASGFKFLFENIHHQIWQIIIGYLSSIEDRNIDKKVALKLLFKISFLTLNKGYNISKLSDMERIIISDLSNFWIIYYNKKINRSIFCITNLSKHLSLGNDLTNKEKNDRGFIILETTFKIYAYTSSKLQIKLLSKFINLEYQLPNMISGKITKKSIMNAINKGINVDLIIDYLEQYSHKLMRVNIPILPINVIDQMRLWENEKKRLKIQKANLIFNINDNNLFNEFIRVVTNKSNNKRTTLLAGAGAPNETNEIIMLIDDFICNFVNNNKTNNNNIFKKALQILISKELPKLILKLLNKLNDNPDDQTLYSRYKLLFKQYGFDEFKRKFVNKTMNLNDISCLSDEIASIHLTDRELNESKSKLLWSNIDDGAMILTPKGYDMVKQYKQSKQSNNNNMDSMIID